ncbi:MAG: GNAT family N-acetyltransferase [Erysipelotrichaceae bacterium]|nr:GNAT family N-acetyltransferase [Erysipelotrichaceae bacterium]
MIHLRTLNLQKINEIEHYCLIQSLSRDKDVVGYIAKDFFEWLKKQQSIGDEKIEVGKSYVIEKEGKYIGVVGSLDFSNDGILEVWYTIKKNLRGRGYGEKILAEITPYLIEHVDGLNDIQLKIDKTNQASKKVASRNGYIEDRSEREDGIESWYYFGRDHFDSKEGRKSR